VAQEVLQFGKTTLQKLYGYEQPSTRRSAELYQRTLFPEFTSQKKFIDAIRNKTILDVGCGLTNRNPYSLLNEHARAQGRDTKGLMVAIDLRAGQPIGSENGFSNGNILDDNIRGLWTQMYKMISGYPVCRDKPGTTNFAGANALRLPFPDETFDHTISSHCLTSWISGTQRGEALAEMVRVTKVGGDVRLHPVHSETEEEMHDCFLVESLLAQMDVQKIATQRYMRTLFDIDNNTFILTRKPNMWHPTFKSAQKSA
jgi:SAM-dependent methyltransferase